MGEFLCHRCNGVLDRDDVSAADMAGHERQSKLHAQLDKLLQLMPQIDAQTIPKNDFDTAFSLAIPIIRDESINPRPKTEPVDADRGPRTAAKGQTNTYVPPLEVSLTTPDQRLVADRIEAQRKADVAAQNALPVWHTASTVTGEVTALGNKERERLATRPGALNLKDETDVKKDGTVLDDELAAYYAQMAQEKAAQAQEDRDSSAEEEDDDEFEDVGIGGASGVATPSSSMSGAANTAKHPLPNGLTNGNENGNGSRRVKNESESSGSAPGTSFSTPAASGAVLEEEERESSPAKRIKLEHSGIGERGEGSLEEVKDSDSEVEFEDAL